MPAERKEKTIRQRKLALLQISKRRHIGSREPCISPPTKLKDRKGQRGPGGLLGAPSSRTWLWKLHCSAMIAQLPMTTWMYKQRNTAVKWNVSLQFFIHMLAIKTLRWRHIHKSRANTAAVSYKVTRSVFHCANKSQPQARASAYGNLPILNTTNISQTS